MFDWKEFVRQSLKTELQQRGLTYDDLVRLLSDLGIRETQASINNKISRGTFSATFLVQCLYAMQTIPIDTEYYTETTAFTILRQYLPKQKIYTHSQKKTKYIDIANMSEKKFLGNKVISLFTGAGGFDVGLEQAGFETAVCVEIDADCRETIRFNRPSWRLFEDANGREAGDVRAINCEELLAFSQLSSNEIALVIGGAPCQPFSSIGSKRGTDDPKNGNLFLEFVRIIKGVRPKAFIFENVVGITHRRHADVITYMTEKLQGLGYGIGYTVLNAADYGVGQQRKRFFLIGIQGVDAPAFPLPTHSENLKSWKAFVEKLDNAPDYVPDDWITVGQILDNIPSESQHRSDYTVMNISALVLERMKLIGPGENFKVLPMDMRPNCWKNGKHQGQDTFGRLRLDEPSVTIRTAAYNPAKGKYIHPTENRGLNTIEMAAIQGFPIDWHFKCKNRPRITLVSAGKQIGNAVPPPLAKALGLAIKSQINPVEEFADTPHQLELMN